MNIFFRILICVILYLLSLPLAIYIINVMVHGPQDCDEAMIRQLGGRPKTKKTENCQKMTFEDIPELDFFEVPPPPEDAKGD